MLLVTACSRGDDDQHVADASVRDAGHDAGRRDAGIRDAGPPRPDAGFDAGPPDPVGWVQLPGFPDGCVIERAEHPEMLFDSEWTSCGTGCQKLSPDPRFLRSVDRDVGYFDGSRFWFFLVQQRFGDIEGHYIVVLAASDGSVAGAWRAPNLDDPGMCMLFPLGVGDGHAVFGVQVGDRVDWPRASPIYHASLDAIGSVERPIATLTEAEVGGSLPQRVGVSASTVVLEVQPRGSIFAIEGGEIHLIGGLGTAMPGLPQETQLVGRTAYWEDWGEVHVRAAFGRVGDAPGLLREVEPDAVRWFQVDETSFSWIEARRLVKLGEYEVVELWTAPYTADAGALEPRLVRPIDRFMHDTRAGGGHYAQLTVRRTQRIITVYDLVDGRRRDFVPEGGRPVFNRPLAIGPDQMLIQVSWDDAVPGRALTIVDLSTLPYVTG
jgi:hypothetical protein